MTSNFDPNSLAINTNNIFGLPYTLEEARLVIVPIPWEVTVSYRCGTARGPQAILNASLQVDLFDPVVPNAWTIGLAMDEISEEISTRSANLRKKAGKYLSFLVEGGNPDTSSNMRAIRDEINQACQDLKIWVRKKCQAHLDAGKVVGLIGGDHSTPLGYIELLCERYPGLGVLQIDAHADLREAYEGFSFSHASIMFNVLKLSGLGKLVQVGIRDLCQAEHEIITREKSKVSTFFDRDIKQSQFTGESWDSTCAKIIACIPNEVYISFDIDGLDPKLCPNTGTPVPGGFELEEVFYLIEKLANSGRKIVGFDINEVSPGNFKNDREVERESSEWNGNVGARALYRISNLCAKSLGLDRN